MTRAEKLYDELMGPTEDDYDKNFERVSDKLIELVIQQANYIAEMVNSQDADEQIQWLLDNGLDASEIKEFVGRTS